MPITTESVRLLARDLITLVPADCGCWVNARTNQTFVFCAEHLLNDPCANCAIDPAVCGSGCHIKRLYDAWKRDDEKIRGGAQ